MTKPIKSTGRESFGASNKVPLTHFSGSSRGVRHPGTFLESRFLQPLSVSQAELARAIGVSRRRINELVVGKRAISPDTAIKLARFFNTDPEFWLTMQMRWDLHQALEKERKQAKVR